MSRVKDDNYYQVSGWMLNKMKLKGTELQVYAIIYGFSQNGENMYTGSLNYLCDWLGTSKPTVIKALKGLVDKKYIFKEQEEVNKVIYNKYKVNRDAIDMIAFGGSKETLMGSKETLLGGSKETLMGSKETLLGGSKETLLGGSKETLPNNNIINNKSYNNNINNKRYKEKESIKEKEPVPPQQGTSSHNGTNNDSFKKIIPHKMNYGEFENVQLTDAELEKLKLRFSNWEERIENLSLYLASTGKKYKSHYATILNWARKDVNGTVKKGKDDLVVTDNQGNKINYAKAGTWL